VHGLLSWSNPIRPQAAIEGRLANHGTSARSPAPAQQGVAAHPYPFRGPFCVRSRVYVCRRAGNLRIDRAFVTLRTNALLILEPGDLRDLIGAAAQRRVRSGGTIGGPPMVLPMAILVPLSALRPRPRVRPLRLRRPLPLARGPRPLWSLPVRRPRFAVQPQRLLGPRSFQPQCIPRPPAGIGLRAQPGVRFLPPRLRQRARARPPARLRRPVRLLPFRLLPSARLWVPATGRRRSWLWPPTRLWPARLRPRLRGGGPCREAVHGRVRRSLDRERGGAWPALFPAHDVPCPSLQPAARIGRRQV